MSPRPRRRRRAARAAPALRAAISVAGMALALAGAALVAAALAVMPSGRRAVPERPDCRIGPTVPGIDVSHHQEVIDWTRVRRAGIRFAFIRVSDGAAVRDGRFAANWAEARRAGVLRGAYQRFRPGQSAWAQADLMIAAMRGRAPGDLPPVIDIEVDGEFAASVVAARARTWIERVRAGLGVEPIVYTSGGLWRRGGAGALAAQPLWLAHYTAGCPTLPPPWTRWMFWQHTERGAVPGIAGPVDLDLFAGTLDDLRAARAALAR